MSQILFDKIVEAVLPRNIHQGKLDFEKEAIIKASFAESILLTDRVLVNNFGPNLNLVVLYNWIGQDLLEQLIHDGVVSFFHSNSTIGFADEKSAKMLNSKHGFLAFEGVGEDFSIHDGTVNILKEQTELSDYDIQRLASLVEANNVECNCFEIASRTADCINDKYGLNSDYLDNAKSLQFLGQSAELNCEFISAKDEYVDYINNYLGRIVDFDQSLSKPFNTLLEYEDLPKLMELSLAEELDFEEIHQLRMEKEAIKFRDWLQNINKEDELNIIKEYTADIYSPLYRSPKRKITSFSVSTSIGIGLAFVDPALAIPAGAAVNAFDQFIAEKIQNNWSPKFFLNKMSNKKEK